MTPLHRLNFSGGPGALPEVVLKEAAEAVREIPGTGQSVLGLSHRSDWFKKVLRESETHLRALLNIPSNYHVLQLQGGSSLQFSMVPMLLLRGRNNPAEYLRTGYWSAKSIPDAQREGRVKTLYDGEPQGFSRLPDPGELTYDPKAAYFHYVSNETVEGLQFSYLPGLPGVRRVCDMSSDFLSRPFNIQDYDLIYAHAQKNMGISGLTLVILKDELLKEAPQNIHSMLDYRNHAAMGSIYNTPPVFAVYVTLLVLRWLRDTIGGIGPMAALNEQKAQALYGYLDRFPGIYRPHTQKKDRSLMNVTFHLPNTELERTFLSEASQAGFYGLEGHRSLGGIRASLYNAVTPDDMAHLLEFLETFRKQNE